jgi:hypothetical protein
MTRSRPGSVVAAARNWSSPSANAVRRGGPPSGAGGDSGDLDAGVAWGGTEGLAGGAGGGALPFGVYVT